RRSIFQSRDHLVRAAFERPRRQTRAQRSASRDIRIYVGGDLQTLSPRGRDALKHLGHAAPILFVSSLEMPNLGRNVRAPSNLKNFFHRIVDRVRLAALMRDVDAAV